MKLPNGASILIGVVLVAALTALAGELPNSADGWLPLAAAAIVGGIAKAVRVWLDAQPAEMAYRAQLARHLARSPESNIYPAKPPSKLRAFFIG